MEKQIKSIVTGVPITLLLGISLITILLLGACQSSAETTLPEPTISVQTLTASDMEEEKPTPTDQIPTVSPTAVSLSWQRLDSLRFITRELVTTMAIDPSDTDIWYVGTRNAGAYKSINAGTSWVPIQSGLALADIDSLVIDPSDPEIVYAGLIFGGVYKTNDGGKSWESFNDGIPLDESRKEVKDEFDVSLVVLSYQNSQHLYYSDGLAVYESEDGATRWQKIASEFPGRILYLVVDPLDDQVLYVLTFENYDQSFVLKSEDGGDTWMQIFDSTYSPGGVNLAVDKVDGHTIYFTSSGDFGFRLFISPDKGSSWQRVYLDSQGLEIFPSPDTANTAYLLGGELKKTTDGGNSWYGISEGVPFIELGALVVIPGQKDRVLLGTSGLFELQSNLEWIDKSAGLGAEYMALYLDPGDQETLYLLGDEYSGLYASEDGGANWDLLSSYDAFQGISQWSLSLTAEGKFYKVISGQFFQSEDKGDTWTEVENVRIYGDIFINPYQPDHFIMHRWPEPCQVSFDGGKSWQEIETPELGPLTKLVFVDGEPEKVYIVADHHWRSEDGGINWERCADYPGSWPVVGQPMAVLDDQDSDTLFVATSNGVLATVDGCRSWQLVSEGYFSGKVNTLSGDPNQPEILYAGTDHGVYVSFDYGGTWQPINDGLLDGLVIYSIVVDQNSRVIAATPLGIFQLENQ